MHPFRMPHTGEADGHGERKVLQSHHVPLPGPFSKISFTKGVFFRRPQGYSSTWAMPSESFDPVAHPPRPFPCIPPNVELVTRTRAHAHIHTYKHTDIHKYTHLVTMMSGPEKYWLAMPCWPQRSLNPRRKTPTAPPAESAARSRPRRSARTPGSIRKGSMDASSPTQH